MINKNLTYAVIGASQNQDKYGYKVFADLHEAGYKVVPINPKGGELLGQKIWRSISDCPDDVDIIIFVVPPAVALQVLQEVNRKGIKTVWFQPGSESDGAIKYCKDRGIKCIANSCIMIERKK